MRPGGRGVGEKNIISTAGALLTNLEFCRTFIDNNLSVLIKNITKSLLNGYCHLFVKLAEISGS